MVIHLLCFSYGILFRCQYQDSCVEKTTWASKQDLSSYPPQSRLSLVCPSPDYKNYILTCSVSKTCFPGNKNPISIAEFRTSFCFARIRRRHFSSQFLIVSLATSSSIWLSSCSRWINSENILIKIKIYSQLLIWSFLYLLVEAIFWYQQIDTQSSSKHRGKKRILIWSYVPARNTCAFWFSTLWFRIRKLIDKENY